MAMQPIVAWPIPKRNPTLSWPNRHEPDCHLADGDEATSDAADGDHAIGHDALARLGAFAVGVMHERQAGPRAMRREFGETVAVGIDKAPPRAPIVSSTR